MKGTQSLVVLDERYITRPVIGFYLTSCLLIGWWYRGWITVLAWIWSVSQMNLITEIFFILPDLPEEWASPLNFCLCYELACAVAGFDVKFKFSFLLNLFIMANNDNNNANGDDNKRNHHHHLFFFIVTLTVVGKKTAIFCLYLIQFKLATDDVSSNQIVI